MKRKKYRISIFYEVFISNLLGEKGDAGPLGPPGAPGEKGARGKRGKRVTYLDIVSLPWPTIT